MRTRITALFLLLAVTLGVFAPTTPAQAVPGLPFGGPILAMIPCNCGGFIWLTVGPPIQYTTIPNPPFFAPSPSVTPNFIWTPWTIDYAFFTMHPGAFLTGEYLVPVGCWIVTGVPPCTEIGEGDLILYQGTSV